MKNLEKKNQIFNDDLNYLSNVKMLPSGTIMNQSKHKLCLTII